MLHDIDVCDAIWCTCCALHIFLLIKDGLDDAWNASRYLGSEGNHDEADIVKNVQCNSVGEIAAAMQLFDMSDMGARSDVGMEELDTSMFPIFETEQNNVIDKDNTIVDDKNVETNLADAVSVFRLMLKQFKKWLIEHFNILY